MIVVDASVIVSALADGGPDGRNVRARVSGEHLAAPEVIDLEVVSAFRRLCSAGRLDGDRAEAAIADLQELRIQRVPHRSLLERCWELRETMTVYDASYVALAESLQATLLTGDQRLAKAPGARCVFEVVS
ncbi:MAG: type II toxin-antitoxin system VapC family toxin [Acidimicrobiales bacterium]